MNGKPAKFSAHWMLILALVLGLARTALAGKPTPTPTTPGFRYNLTLLGTLGGPSSFATGQNNLGDVVGKSRVNETRSEGFLWSAASGQMININALLGFGD